MPISTSPYQNNDYQAASAYQPYKLPTQQIAQTALALDQFWKAGAARVKAASDSVLDINLTSDENKDVRDKFMKEAQEQLTKLATGDLSNVDVQKEGLNIFKPIFQDQAIMQDDHLTSLKANIFSEADKYKKDVKTGGAGFNVDNLAYALKGFQGFNNKTSRNQIGDIYESAKDSEYIPFYDDTKERIDIMKLCPKDKLSNMTQNAGYLDTYTNSSLTKQNLFGCLEGGLSERASQQNRISGTVKYGNDYKAVKKDYIQTANDRIEFYTDSRNTLHAQREALSKDPTNKDLVDELDKQIKEIDANIEKVNFQIKGNPNATNPSEKVGILGWDDDYMKLHYEDLAANAYFQRRNGAFASAFASQDILTKKQVDPKYITEYVQNELNKRQAIDHTNAIEMENIKFKNKLALGTDENGNKIDNLTRFKLCAQTLGCNLAQFMTEAYKEEGTTSGKIEGQINTLNAQKFDIIKDMKNDPFVKGITGNLELGDASAFNEDNYKKAMGYLNAYVDKAIDSDPNKKKILEVTNKLLEIDNRKTILGSILSDAREIVDTENPNIRKNYEIKKQEILSRLSPTIALNNGAVVSRERVGNIIEGTDADAEYSIKQQMTTYGGHNNFIVDKAGNIVGGMSLADKIFELSENKKTSYKSLLDKYLGENTAVQKMGFATGDLFTKGSPGERDMQSLFGNYLVNKDSGEITFNSVGGLDPVTGKVRIQATGSKSGPISAKNMRDALAKNGIAQSVYPSMPDDQTLEIVLPSAVRDIVPLFQPPKYSEVLRMQLTYLDKKAASLPPNGVIMQVGKDRTGALFSIKTTKKIGSTLPQFTMIINKNGKSQELPFKNTMGMDEKENILVLLDRYLEGIDNPNK